MSESKDLLSDFPAISDQEWKDKIINDLRGKVFEDTLLWEDENEITHQPYYRSSAIANKAIVEQIQAAQANDHGWKTVQVFQHGTNKLKSKVKEALGAGVDEVVIDEVSDSKATKKDLGDALKDSPHVHFRLTQLANNSIPKVYFSDPIAEMLHTGKRNEADLQALKDIFQKRLNQLKPDNFLVVDGSVYKNAGATIIQEVALSLHHAVEYLDLLTEEGYTAEAVARSFTFKTGIGTSYCSEIAKARALRFLIKKVFNLYQVNADIKIWGEASTYNLAHQDPYTNLLRLSTQCMSAILGNCNLISLPAHDHWGEGSTLGYRMAKNIPLILKNESYFNEVKDLAAGSNYIEHLTAEIAEKAWDLFLGIEKEGGLLQQLKEGKLATMMEESKGKRNQSYQNGKTLLGVNKFMNTESEDFNPKIPQGEGLNPAILSKDISA